jgi:hypothetical protein
MAGNVVEVITVWLDCAGTRINSGNWRNVAEDDVRLQTCGMRINKKEL